MYLIELAREQVEHCYMLHLPLSDKLNNLSICSRPGEQEIHLLPRPLRTVTDWPNVVGPAAGLGDAFKCAKLSWSGC